VATGAGPRDDGAIEPPPSVPSRSLSSEEEELAGRDPELDDGDVAVAGCPARTRAIATAKPVAAVRATVRFAACARFRPASTLVRSGTSPLSRPRMRPV